MKHEVALYPTAAEQRMKRTAPSQGLHLPPGAAKRCEEDDRFEEGTHDIVRFSRHAGTRGNFTTRYESTAIPRTRIGSLSDVSYTTAQIRIAYVGPALHTMPALRNYFLTSIARARDGFQCGGECTSTESSVHRHVLTIFYSVYVGTGMNSKWHASVYMRERMGCGRTPNWAHHDAWTNVYPEKGT